MDWCCVCVDLIGAVNWHSGLVLRLCGFDFSFKKAQWTGEDVLWILI
jgi:hypothetical protein